ncbi:hypothetical protein [Corynebacterium sp. UBA2622]|uniref:hypothetical protein n=1 Tax=Corynebacterium sp. UBA2622 TaxID=1946393 RepID=UPI0025B7F95D|nr:hypothetical protein [Corynebacterium sp. UBA2622]
MTATTRVFLATLTIFLAALASGCGRGQGEEQAAPSTGTESASRTVTASDTGASPSESPRPPFPPDEPLPADARFTFASGPIELGRANGEPELFDACAGITPDELKKAGLSPASNGAFRNDTQIACTTMKDTGAVAYVISSMRGDRDTLPQLDSTFTLREVNASKKVPAMYVAQLEDLRSKVPMCGAFVDTRRGALGVTVMDVHGKTPVDAMCADAKGTLEALYAVGK